MDGSRRTQWLSSIVLVLTATLLLALLGRVVWIDRHVTAAMREQLARQHMAQVSITPIRGGIIAADGSPLALSVRMYNLYADPAFIVDPEEKLSALKGEDLNKAKEMLVEALSPLLKKPVDELLFQLEDNVFYKKEATPGAWVETDKPRRFLWLAKEVDEDFHDRFLELRKRMQEEARDAGKIAGKSKDPAIRSQQSEKARLLAHTLDGVGFQKSFKRIYPQGQLASSIVGFAGNDGGVDAMEYQLEPLLKGFPGLMYVMKDASRRTLDIQDQRYTPPDDGRDVWLTINSVDQGIVEEELQKAVQEKGAASGCAVAMDPYSGRILAMANYPTFDPAHYGTADPDLRRNKSDTDPFEPGSIFKPFVVAWAIEKHIVKPSDVFDCHGGRYIDPTGRTVTDTHGYGALTVHDILVKSSNVGMTQIGWKMGIPELYNAVTTFGFGRRTGVELPGDQKGIVKALHQWNKGTLTSVSFGYEVSATPLQLVRAFATFANGGYLVTPRIINAVEDSPGKTVAWSDVAGSPLQQQIISRQTCDTMRGIMADVLGPEGTARTAASKVYTMYGKTGTAKLAATGAGHGYGDKFYDSSFLCGGPVKDPRVVVIVTLHKPDKRIAYYGGTVSAPAATAIVERILMYMQVPADKQAEEKPAKAGH
jgi:cell division protein FtsI (penicillin-binding protein 3)